MGFYTVLALAGTALSCNLHAEIVRYALDLPREPLDNALRAFAHQTGLQIARFSDATASDVQVGPVLGNLTSEEAMRTLLAGSGLTYRVLNERTIAIIKQQEETVTRSSASFSSTDNNFGQQGSLNRSGQLEEVLVTGIRNSLDQSLTLKRAATSIEEVVTAEGVHKLPAKNVVDILQHVPGMNTQSDANGDGGYDENNRVSIRGTRASLTQTTINGHPLATADWFLQDQSGTVGRSVSYELLPSEIVQRVVVHKTQMADLVEGGIAGSVDLQTPKPLDFRQPLTVSALVGGVYSDLPSMVQPQLNGLFNWRNDQGGLLVMGFLERRASRRDAQEITYYKVPADIAAGWRAVNPTLPDVTGAQMPFAMGPALFQQERQRAGGLLAFELKPADRLTLDLNGFYSRLGADNTNRSFLSNSGVSPDHAPESLTLANGTLVSAIWPARALTLNTGVFNAACNKQAVVLANSASYYVDLVASFLATDKLKLHTQVGYTRGIGNVPKEWTVSSPGGYGSAFSYSLHGLGSPVSITYPGLNVASDQQFFTFPGYTEVSHSIDEERYAQLDALLKIDSGALEAVKLGARFASLEREERPTYSSTQFWDSNTPPPTFTGSTYPSNFGTSLGGGGYPRNIFTYSEPAIVAYYDAALANSLSAGDWGGQIEVKERNWALYAMASFGGDLWSGSLGVRLVYTQNDNLINVIAGTSTPGTDLEWLHHNNYFDALPSVNLKFDLAANLVLHAAAARTLARPDYNELGQSFFYSGVSPTGISGNPTLKPARATNYDSSLEWYYEPQSLLELELFYMDLSSYVDVGNRVKTLSNPFTRQLQQYTITLPLNTTARVKGMELSWTQPLGFGFGVQTNFTYSDGRAAQGRPMLGNSRMTYILGGYYESHGFSARLDYTFRSHYLVEFEPTGLPSSTIENKANLGDLAAAFNYSVTDNLGLALKVLNISNATVKYYGSDTSQPRAFYSYGRQYYFDAQVKF